MKQRYKRFLCLLCLICLLPAWAFAQESSAVQIRHAGGSDDRDGVKISKPIQGTDTENVFDITLSVETPHSLAKLRQAEDTAVVLVMDVSATMNQQLQGDSGPTRLDAAKEAARVFITAFSDPDKLLGAERELGFVTFNRDAQTLFPLEKADAAKAVQWAERIGGVTAPDGSSGLRWTNIEGGLLLARNLLAESDAVHKCIILLSDGFPTTYPQQSADVQSTESLPGRDPTSGFRDGVKNVECTMGVSYSETAAQRAKAAASAIRESGVSIFSIGVGIGSPIEVPAGSGNWMAETIQAHIDRITWNASVVERPSEAADPDYRYEIGAADDPDSYRYWLGGRTEGGGIGGGPDFAEGSAVCGPYGAYADANDAETLERVFAALLSEMESINQSAIRDTWIASDPMGGEVDFLHFLNAGENAVSFAENTLSWDLQASPHTTSTQGDTTLYTYTLRYRVRLKNEMPSFPFATPDNHAEEPACPTNGKAALHYKVEENGRLSEDRALAFAQPMVEGYAGTLAFLKTTTETGGAHSGASFSLTHRNDCPVCGGSVVIAPLSGTSDADGQTVIPGIPSGHSYRLLETGSTAYLQREYRVEVHYGKTTLLDAQGNPTDTIVNELRPGSIALSARKVMDGDIPADDLFFFQLTDEQGAVIETRSSSGGAVAFAPLFFSVPGRYGYQIREVQGGQADVLYDETVYHILIEAAKTDGGCVPRILSILRNGQPYTGEMLFQNRTRPPITPAPSPTPGPSDPPLPQTGDAGQPLLWGTLLVLSVLGAAAILWRAKKN